VERFIVGGSGERMADGVTEALIGGPTLEPPIAGHDVVLTLDLELQELAEKSVRRHPAAAVALAEVETGRILALVSTPSFDPAAMSRDHAGAERERLDSDPRRPHLDRTLGASFPPASTFKLITAIAGLEDGLASPDEKLTCTGQRTEGKRVLRDMHVHGTIDFIGALQVSCNIYFWKIAERVGIARMVEVARDLGLGEPTGMGVNGDVPGQLPDGPLAAAQAARDLVPTLNAAIGAGDVKATPVQLAMAYAAVANGGRLYAPQVVLRVQAASGEVVEAREPILRRAVNVEQSTLGIVRQGMWRAVNTGRGTAHAAQRGAIRMAGKTGTAQPSRPRPPAPATLPGWDPAVAHAWFVGWAPWDRPQIVVVVLVEHGGGGGAVAAPIARKIVDGYFARRPARGAVRQR
jgi:penicillin-binding protein 2